MGLGCVFVLVTMRIPGCATGPGRRYDGGERRYDGEPVEFHDMNSVNGLAQILASCSIRVPAQR